MEDNKLTNQEQENNSKTILLVDDEPDILSLYSEILQLDGLNVDIAHNGNDALIMAQSKKYDLILLDIMMDQGPNGLDVLKILRSEVEKYGHPIVVMLTNLRITDAIRDAFELGADGYLVKLSLTNEQLVKKVKGFLFGFKRL